MSQYNDEGCLSFGTSSTLYGCGDHTGTQACGIKITFILQEGNLNNLASTNRTYNKLS
jgi:hypothetical protein